MTTFVDKFLDKIEKNFKSTKEIKKNDYVIYIKKLQNKIGISLQKNDKSKKEYNKFVEISKNLSIGTCGKKFFDKFERDYREDFIERILKIKNFDSENKEEVYFHISPKPITELKENIKESFWLPGVMTFNPDGFWYSCGTSWLDWYFGENPNEYLDLLFKNIRGGKNYGFVKEPWYPWNVYILNLDSLKIGEIENCDDLFSFSRKYKCRNPTKDRYLSLKKIKKDYDGIQICPYLGIKCNSFFKKMLPEQKIGKNTRDLDFEKLDWFRILSLALNGKISKKDQSVIWSFYWEASTGVVLKNIKKIELTKLI